MKTALFLQKQALEAQLAVADSDAEELRAKLDKMKAAMLLQRKKLQQANASGAAGAPTGRGGGVAAELAIEEAAEKACAR